MLFWSLKAQSLNETAVYQFMDSGGFLSSVRKAFEGYFPIISETSRYKNTTVQNTRFQAQLSWLTIAKSSPIFLFSPPDFCNSNVFFSKT